MRARKLLSCSLVFLCAVLLYLSACKSRPAEPEHRYPIEGTVISIDKAHQQVTLKHKDIPGFMKAMTMPFKVRDQWALDILEPGDTVNATLVVTEEGELENISINKDQRRADLSSTSDVHFPNAGDRIPDFKFTDQEGRRSSIAHFRGRPLLLTFIYTRCPLPDFCIRMSSNYVQLAKQMKGQNPVAYSKLQMLSISIDPEFDKPAVLKQYAANYMGSLDPRLEHWTLGVATPEETRKAAAFFGLSYTKSDLQIVHDLRTAIIDSDGRLVVLYRGNEWKPSDVAAELARLQK